MRTLNSFERNLLVQISQVREDGITLLGNLYEEFHNVYGIAHGGYLYTLAHVACQLTGELCLGGRWEVQSADCVFLHPLRIFPAMVTTQWITRELPCPMVRGEVRDRMGSLCFRMQTVLRPAGEPPTEIVTHTPTIITDRPLPKNPYDKPDFPCMSSTYSKWLNIFATSMTEEAIVYSADLSAVNCDEYGRAHPATLFTAADCAAGGCLFYIDAKRPITVSANIHYLRPTCHGPVHAVPKPIRKGKVLNFYDVALVDGVGETVAVSHFIIRDMDRK